MTVKEFKELCFEFGIELDSVTTESEMHKKGEKNEAELGAVTGDEVIYKIEVSANRYDQLCVEGIARSLGVFLGTMNTPSYVVDSPQLRMVAQPSVQGVRDVVVCAVLRNITFTEWSYKSFIDMQDKLHKTVCRERQLASIGTHDLDTLKPPFRYVALPPEQIVFAPLKCTTPMNGKQLMAHLEKDLKLGPYLNIIRDKPTYPVLYDSADVVLSLPPIINGNHSKITLNTKNVFIEVTATDLTKANIVLQTVCAMFSEYCSPRWHVEQVEVVQADGKTMRTPDMSARTQEASVSYINNGLGLKLTAAEMLPLLHRMGLEGSASADGETLSLSVPVTRSDVLHQCDVLEDVAIAYGYNNLVPIMPPTRTVGSQLPRTKLAELLAREIASAGFCEVMNFALCWLKDNFKMLQRPDDNSAVTIRESKTAEFESGRTTLLSGLLHTASYNNTVQLPLRLFEIGDVILRDASAPVGARNQQNLAALYCGTSAGFQYIHGLLDHVMLLLAVPHAGTAGVKAGVATYHLERSADPLFIDTWGTDIYVNDKRVGVMGIVHPHVLGNFEVSFPCSMLELSLECPNNL
eukprot:TRINITY_DN5684_c0_g1_i3.p2 TRINITY_DN5684_c0_g1~~TRINITY_DN5684_c0_g1_i3.p2  ORF type:complete len:617 (-),score=203.11 TRINITY_DN5684_c0_g1_i3:1994-3727(-)